MKEITRLQIAPNGTDAIRGGQAIWEIRHGIYDAPPQWASQDKVEHWVARLSAGRRNKCDELA